jgi:hypothetical protein
VCDSQPGTTLSHPQTFKLKASFIIQNLTDFTVGTLKFYFMRQVTLIVTFVQTSGDRGNKLQGSEVVVSCKLLAWHSIKGIIITKPVSGSVHKIASWIQSCWL